MKKIFGVSTLLVCGFAFSAAAAPRPKPELSAAGQTSTTLTGPVSSTDGKFFITDSATQKVVEVRGKNLAKWTGKKARVTGQVEKGTLAVPEIVVITSIAKAGGAALVGGTAAAAGVKAGVSTAAIAGVGAAGATAATVGSLVATDVIGGNDNPASSQ